MAKLEGASAGVKDVIGEDGKHFFELLRLGQEAKELAAVLEARFGSLDKRVQADRKAVLEKLEQLRTQNAAYELQERISTDERKLQDTEHALRILQARFDQVGIGGDLANRISTEEVRLGKVEMSSNAVRDVHTELGRVEMLGEGAQRLGVALQGMGHRVQSLVQRVATVEASPDRGGGAQRDREGRANDASSNDDRDTRNEPGGEVLLTCASKITALSGP